MSLMPHHMQSQEWLDHVFSAQSARAGGVVRRKVRDVERLVGREAFFEDLRQRGYQAIENNGHFVVFCNKAPLSKVV